MNDNLRNLLDKIKETAYYAGKVASDGAEAVGSKAGELYESAKTRVRIFEIESDIRAELKALGLLVYATHSTGTADESAIDERIASLDALYEKLGALKSEDGAGCCSGGCCDWTADEPEQPEAPEAPKAPEALENKIEE